MAALGCSCARDPAVDTPGMGASAKKLEPEGDMRDSSVASRSSVLSVGCSPWMSM